MNKTYYIFRHRVGVPRHLDVCLADEKNGSNFIFQTKDAAQRCLEKEFRKGRAFHDQKYGYVKHYIRYFYSYAYGASQRPGLRSKTAEMRS